MEVGLKDRANKQAFILDANVDAALLIDAFNQYDVIYSEVYV